MPLLLQQRQNGDDPADSQRLAGDQYLHRRDHPDEKPARCACPGPNLLVSAPRFTASLALAFLTLDDRKKENEQQSWSGGGYDQYAG